MDYNFHLNPTKYFLKADVKSDLSTQSLPTICFCIETIEGHVKYHLKDCQLRVIILSGTNAILYYNGLIISDS